MMNSSVFSLVIVLSCAVTQTANCSVTGFLETFSGSGTGAGFDNPGWQAFGSVTEEAGFLNFQSVGETPIGILRRQIQGMGSFRTTLEFRDLYLGETDDWQSGSNVFLSHILGGGVGGFLLSAANDWEVKAGNWRLVTQSFDELNDKVVPASPHSRIVVEYSHVARTVQFTFKCLSVDTCGEVVIGPVAYEGSAIDSPSNQLLVTIGTGGLGNVAGGNLDYVSFVPLDAGLGDFSGDGSLDVDDIDMLSRAASIRDGDLVFDVDRSGAVDGLDVATWVHKLRNTYIGDVNLDNLFDARDLVTVFQQGEYDDGVFQNSRWSSGDWNTDGEFSSADLISAFQDGGYDAEPRHPATVPEPTMMAAGLGALAWLNRKRLAG